MKSADFSYGTQQIQFTVSHIGADGYVRIRMHPRIKA
jgi:hypothetical protein